MNTKKPFKPLHKPLNLPKNDLLSHVLIDNWLMNAVSFNTREARRVDLDELISFTKIKSVDDLKLIQRTDIIAWRDSLLGTKELPRYSLRSVKRKMSSVSKFFSYLWDESFIENNPFIGVERPKLISNEGVTAPISEQQARDLLESPDLKSVIGKRDRAILATFLFHALRRSELCQLRLKDIQEREGIKQFRILGKGDKERYIPVHPVAARRIYDYLLVIGNPTNEELPVFRSHSNNGKNSSKGLTSAAIYQLVIKYGLKVGIDITHFSPHSLRATAATNALNNKEDIRRVQKWLGHASIQTTAMYDKRDNRPQDSPTYRVRY